MNKLLIVPTLIFIVLFSLISMSYFYPYFVTMKMEISNEKYFYDLICFTLNISEKRVFGCYYVVNITTLKILNKTYNISYSFDIFSNFVSKDINFNIPNNIANKIENYPYVRITIIVEVTVISSLNTIVKKEYQLYGNFTNNYLEYIKAV